jgi:hypothetical protein
VNLPSHTVTAPFTYYAKAVGLNIIVDCIGDVVQTILLRAKFYTFEKTAFGYVDELLMKLAYLPHGESSCRVAVKAFIAHAYVDAYNIAAKQLS